MSEMMRFPFSAKSGLNGALGAQGRLGGRLWVVLERRREVWPRLGASWLVWWHAGAVLGLSCRLSGVSLCVLEPLGSNLERFGGSPAVQNHGKT